MNGAFGGNLDVAIEPAHQQQLADLAGAPVRLLELEAPCSGRKACSRSCGRCRTPGRPRSWLPHPEAERQSEGALPLPNWLSTVSTPPAEQARSTVSARS